MRTHIEPLPQGTGHPSTMLNRLANFWIDRPRRVIAPLCFFLLWTTGTPALATQGHAGIEGVWVHQFAHLFFLFSMLLLIYWLRQAGLVREPGWRSIQYAALFFILWNVDTILVHFLDEQILAVQVQNLGDWRIHVAVEEGREWLAAFYYLAKLDHLLCVPAMVFLMLGLRHMLNKVRPVETGTGVR